MTHHIPRRYKTLLFNLSDNKELVENIFSGEITAHDLVRKPAADLVNSQIKKKLEAKKEESFNQYVLATLPPLRLSRSLWFGLY